MQYSEILKLNSKLNKPAVPLMSVNDLSTTLHMPQALERQFNGEQEIAHSLPPSRHILAFSVDRFTAAPTNWMNGSSKASSYFVPVEEGHGLWLDLNSLYNHTHHVAAVISIQGINPVTGKKSDPIRLEQYKENCPVHNIAFKANNFCDKCKYSWPTQNYLSTTGTPNGLLWLDGFRTEDGSIRQWIFTEEQIKGVAKQIIGNDRVFAIGVAFYLSKEEKPKPAVRIANRSVYSMPEKYYSASSLDWSSDTATDYAPATYNVNISSTTGLPGSTSLVGQSMGPEYEVKTSGGIMKAASKGMTTNSVRSPAAKKETKRVRGGKKNTKLEIGAGALIAQEVYKDPYSLDFWTDEPAGFIYINYCNYEQVAEILTAGEREEKSEGFLDSLNLAK